MHRRASERGHRESRVARETRYPQYLAQTQTVRETLRLKRAANRALTRSLGEIENPACRSVSTLSRRCINAPLIVPESET